MLEQTARGEKQTKVRAGCSAAEIKVNGVVEKRNSVFKAE